MGLRNTFYVGLLSVTLLSGCSLFSGEDDVVKMSPLPKIENQFKVQKVWQTSVGDGVGDYYSHLRPVAMDGVIFAADRFGMVKAINEDNGKQIWRISLAEKPGFFSFSQTALLSGGLSAANGKIFVSSEKAKAYALSAEDGSLFWQTTVAGEALSRPVISDGMVLIHTSNGMLQALDENSGEIKWTVNLDVPVLSLRGESAPAVAFGAAIVGGDNGRVSAVLMEQGQLIWQQRISQPMGATEIARLNDIDITPVIDGEIVYVIGYNGSLAALDLRTGQILWKREYGSVNDFIVDNDRIYVVDQNDRVISLSANGGIALWTQSELLHRNLTAPALFDGYVVVGDSEGYLHWLDRDSGRFVSQHRVDSSGLLSAPQVINGNLVIQARGGKVYSFSPVR